MKGTLLFLLFQSSLGTFPGNFSGEVPERNFGRELLFSKILASGNGPVRAECCAFAHPRAQRRSGLVQGRACGRRCRGNAAFSACPILDRGWVRTRGAARASCRSGRHEGTLRRAALPSSSRGQATWRGTHPDRDGMAVQHGSHSRRRTLHTY